MRKHNSGFTLIELMIAVAIIGILSSIGVTSYRYARYRAMSSEAKSMLSAIYTQEKAFFIEYGSYTSRLDVLGFAPDGTVRYNIGFSNDFMPPGLNIGQALCNTTCYAASGAAAQGNNGNGFGVGTGNGIGQGIGNGQGGNSAPNTCPITNWTCESSALVHLDPAVNATVSATTFTAVAHAHLPQYGAALENVAYAAGNGNGNGNGHGNSTTTTTLTQTTTTSTVTTTTLANA